LITACRLLLQQRDRIAIRSEFDLRVRRARDLRACRLASRCPLRAREMRNHFGGGYPAGEFLVDEPVRVALSARHLCALLPCSAEPASPARLNVLSHGSVFQDRTPPMKCATISPAGDSPAGDISASR